MSPTVAVFDNDEQVVGEKTYQLSLQGLVDATKLERTPPPNNSRPTGEGQNYRSGLNIATIILTLKLAVLCVALCNTIIARAIP